MHVWYMNGAGNDFMVVDIRRKKMELPTLAKELCKLKNADGFMALDHSEEADFRLHFYNADGSRAALCGNGLRCLCRFAWENGIAGDAMTVQTDAGILPGQRIGRDLYRVRMPSPGVPDLLRFPGAAYVEVGVPHLVREFSGDLWEDAPRLKEQFRALRHNPALKQGANVNYYTRTGDTFVRVLTYERGVEDFTQACGTGCCAVAAVLRASGALPGGRLTAQNRGGVLTVIMEEEDNKISALFLEGAAEITDILEI